MTRIIRWLVGVLTLGLVAFLTLPTAAYASAIPEMPDGGAGGTLFVVSAPIVTIISALVIPLLNGFLTRVTLSSWVKGLITLVLNGLVALWTTGQLEDGTAVFGEQMLFTWFIGWGVSMLSYLGVYRPARLSSSVIEVNGVEIAGRLANVGIK